MADPTYGITHKRVLSIALPIVISNATVPILGAVDTGVIGQLGGAAPIGAVGIGAIILGALYWIFGFLRMGTVGLTSQALGAGDAQEVRALFFRSAGIGVLAGLAFIIFQIPIFAGAFWIAPASVQVESLARDYMSIRVWSAPAAIAIYGLSGWLIAQERTRAVLMIQLFMNVTNIILDFWFVLGLGLGLKGCRGNFDCGVGRAGSGPVSLPAGLSWPGSVLVAADRQPAPCDLYDAGEWRYINSLGASPSGLR